MTSSLEDWRPEGRVCLWRYKPMPRMYAGWHFTADGPGCRALIDLLRRLETQREAAHRTMPVSDPVVVGVDRIFGAHELGVRRPEKLRIAFDPQKVEARPLVETGDDRLVLTVGPAGIDAFKAAVQDVGLGEGDFSVGLGNPAGDGMDVMTFWWWPKNP